MRIICYASCATTAEWLLDKTGYEGLSVLPVPLDADNCPDYSLVEAAKTAWNDALSLGEKHGYHVAQSTVVLLQRTIGLVMDCDTTDVEPDFALVKFKKLAGGGYFKIINRVVPGFDTSWLHK